MGIFTAIAKQKDKLLQAVKEKRTDILAERATIKKAQQDAKAVYRKELYNQTLLQAKKEARKKAATPKKGGIFKRTGKAYLQHLKTIREENKPQQSKPINTTPPLFKR